MQIQEKGLEWRNYFYSEFELRRQHFFQLVILSFIWGSSFLFLRIAAPEFGPILLITVRVLIAGLVLLVPLYFSKEWPVLKKHWRAIFVSGIFGTAIPFTLVAYSALYATSSFVSILNATVPIFSVVVVYFWLKEKPSKTAFLGVTTGFIGVLILNGDKVSVSETFGWLAVSTGLAASFFYSLTSPHRKLYLEGVSPLVVTVGSQLFSAMAMMPLALFFLPEQMPGLAAWGSAIFLGIVCTAFALLLFFRLLMNVGIEKTISVTYLIPVSAIFLGFSVLGEPITWQIITGGSLILLGVGFTTEFIRFGAAKKH